MLDYIRYCPTTFIYYPIIYAGLLLGGTWQLMPVLFITASQILIDNFTPPDTKVLSVKYPAVFNLYLYLHLPFGIGTLLLMLWQVAPENMLGIGGLLAQVLGSWVLERQVDNSMLDLILCGLLGGFTLSSNTIVAHELVHRLSKPISVILGRWLLAMNCDAQFSISHVYGHHRNVGTNDDPATARRGESLYRFFVRSTIGQYKEAVDIERARLAKQGLKFWCLHNRLLSGIAMSIAVAAVCYALAGWPGLGVFLLAACYSKFLFETVNYIEHYGLVRVPNTRVESHHSWDCISRACTNAYFALPRHVHHHAKPVLPFWKLEPSILVTKGLGINNGYLAAMYLAMLPPLWFRMTTPLLLRWDKEVATDGERKLAQEANRKSGIPQLMQSSAQYNDNQIASSPEAHSSA
jgi:fatty acid desaturase